MSEYQPPRAYWKAKAVPAKAEDTSVAGCLLVIGLLFMILVAFVWLAILPMVGLLYFMGALK